VPVETGRTETSSKGSISPLQCSFEALALRFRDKPDDLVETRIEEMTGDDTGELA